MGWEQTLGSVRVALPCAAFNSSLCLIPQKLEYTMGDSSDMPSRKELTSEELCKQMDKLLKENPNNQRIYDWIEVRVGTQCLSVWRLPAGSLSSSQSFTSLLQANLSEQQVSSNTFIRALMTSVCHLAIVCEYQGEVGAVGVLLPTLPFSHPIPCS